MKINKVERIALAFWRVLDNAISNAWENLQDILPNWLRNRIRDHWDKV